jgi:hypothetical protein
VYGWGSKQLNVYTQWRGGGVSNFYFSKNRNLYLINFFSIIRTESVAIIIRILILTNHYNYVVNVCRRTFLSFFISSFLDFGGGDRLLMKGLLVLTKN